MSFIPAKCIECGGTLSRKSNVNPILVCVNDDCKKEFEMCEIFTNLRLAEVSK